LTLSQESNSLKIRLVLKEKEIASDLLNKNHCENILFASFQGKVLAKPK